MFGSRIGWTKVTLPNGTYAIVSTIGDVLPALSLGAKFETMIFVCDEYGEVQDWMDRYVRFYTNVDDAHLGHLEVVAQLEAGTLTLREYDDA